MAKLSQQWQRKVDKGGGAAFTKKGTKVTQATVDAIRADEAHLEVVADHTDEVIEQLGLAVARALEAIGIEAESDAADICPVDTGRLKNSITHTIDAGGKWAVVGTNVEYAAYVHNGTSTHAAV